MNIQSYKLELTNPDSTITLIYQGNESIIIQDNELVAVANPDLTFRKQIHVPRAALEQFLKLIEVT